MARGVYATGVPAQNVGLGLRPEGSESSAEPQVAAALRAMAGSSPMTAEVFLLRFLLFSFAGLVNRQQQQVLEYLVEENRVLKEELIGRRLRLTDDQRRRLAAKCKRIGRRLLMQVATIVTPDMILWWHRRLISAKWTYPTKRVGRSGIGPFGASGRTRRLDY